MTIGTIPGISRDLSLVFARLSGDFNPLHFDDVIARGTPFGCTVVHGIHMLLSALEEVVRRGEFVAKEPGTLSVVFSSPVATGCGVSVHTTTEQDRLQMDVRVGDKPALSALVRWAHDSSDVDAGIDDEEFIPERPLDLTFPPSLAGGREPLRLSKNLLRALFPSLAEAPLTAWIADLLATSRIAGMRCPGLHSIYGGCRLRQIGHDSSCQQAMSYRIEGIERKFKLVRLGFTGVRFQGTVNTFFRPYSHAIQSASQAGDATSAGGSSNVGEA